MYVRLCVRLCETEFVCVNAFVSVCLCEYTWKSVCVELCVSVCEFVVTGLVEEG